MKKVKIIAIILLIVLLIPIIISCYIVNVSKSSIQSEDKLANHYDIAIVLGCSVLRNGKPSLMLRDRLNKGIFLWTNGIVDKILITGDHNDGYSEVDVMYKYLINSEVDKDSIIIDREGYSTSESLLNYHKNYAKKKAIIVTQQYHLYRSLYIAKKLNLDVIGVPADNINYRGQIFRELREVLARNKDFLKMNFIS